MVAAPTGSGAWQLEVIDDRGETLKSVGFANYGSPIRTLESTLDLQLAHLKFKRLDDWRPGPSGTLEAPVERF